MFRKGKESLTYIDPQIVANDNATIRERVARFNRALDEHNASLDAIERPQAAIRDRARQQLKRLGEREAKLDNEIIRRIG